MVPFGIIVGIPGSTMVFPSPTAAAIASGWAEARNAMLQ